MNVMCHYLKSPKDLVSVITNFESTGSCLPLFLRGYSNKNKDKTKVVGANKDVLIIHKRKDSKTAEYHLYAKEKSLLEYDGMYVDLSVLENNNMFQAEDAYVSIVRLLTDKAKNTGNPFELEFRTNNGATTIASDFTDGQDEDVSVAGVIKGVNGKIVAKGTAAIRSLSDAIDIKGFKYSIISSDLHKDVAVAKNSYEIFREIARYLNRVISVASIESGKLTVRYISQSAFAEVNFKDDGKFYIVRKPSFSSITPFSVSVTTDNIDDVISDVVRKKV